MSKGSDDGTRIDDRGGRTGGGGSGGSSGSGGSGRGGADDPADHDVGDDNGVDDPTTHDIGDDNGVDDPATHDVGDDNGVDDPATHDVGDDHGVDDPATHDVGDDHGVDDPATHDIGDDHGVDDPATHDVGDDHGGERLQLVFNERTGQWLFSDDAAEAGRWADDHGRHGGEVRISAAGADDRTVEVWRFHDTASDVYFWTADARQKDDLIASHPEIEFEGEAFKAFADDHGGNHQAIGVVWDQGAGRVGSFSYLPVDDAVKLAGQSDSDDLVYLGVAFYI
ncbi:MAG: hypothetical protein U1F56_17110 [Rubrivivax sp.]